MSHSRVLVTGGAGFIKSHLVDRLIKEDHEVVVLDNFFSVRIENIKHYLESGRLSLVKGDVRDLEDVEEAMGEVDAVFHLAAVVSVSLSRENPLLVNDANA